MTRSTAVPLIFTCQVLRVGLTALAFAGFYLGGAILSWVVFPVLSLACREPVRRRVAFQAMVRRSFVLFHDCLRIGRLLSFDSRAVDVLRDGPPCIFVANHPTLVDVTALLSVYRSTVCVVKTPLLRSWAVGSLLRSCRYIDNNDQGGLTGGSVLPEALQRIGDGMSVLIFPEGTRSHAGRHMRRFKRGAFEIAIRAGVPIVPIFLYCDPPVLSKDAPWYRAPKRVPELIVEELPALDPVDWHGNSRAMAVHVQAMLQERIEARVRLETGAAAAGFPEPQDGKAADDRELARSVGLLWNTGEGQFREGRNISASERRERDTRGNTQLDHRHHGRTVRGGPG